MRDNSLNPPILMSFCERIIDQFFALHNANTYEKTAENKAASSPPVPALISTMTLRFSRGSLGIIIPSAQPRVFQLPGRVFRFLLPPKPEFLHRLNG